MTLFPGYAKIAIAGCLVGYFRDRGERISSLIANLTVVVENWIQLKNILCMKMSVLFAERIKVDISCDRIIFIIPKIQLSLFQ